MEPDAGESVAKFTWPPRSADAAARAGILPSPRGGVNGASGSRWVAWLREVEATLLPPTSVTLGERLAETGYLPDLPDAYCPRCGASAGPHEATLSGCAECRDSPLPWSRFVRVGPYEGVLAEAIKEAKLTAFRRLARDLGFLAGRRIADALVQAGVDPCGAILVPVPTSFRRRVYRGIDHTLELARGAAGAMDCRLMAALERHHRPSQTRLPTRARARNIAGSMMRSARVEVGGTGPVVILDDVRTTGATLREAWRAMGDGVPLERRWSGVVGVASAPGRRSRVDSGAQAS